MFCLNGFPCKQRILLPWTGLALWVEKLKLRKVLLFIIPGTFKSQCLSCGCPSKEELGSLVRQRIARLLKALRFTEKCNSSQTPPSSPRWNAEYRLHYTPVHKSRSEGVPVRSQGVQHGAASALQRRARTMHPTKWGKGICCNASWPEPLPLSTALLTLWKGSLLQA